VAELSKALTQVATAPPQTVIDDTWIETPASSQQMSNFARNQIRSMNVVDDAPWVVGGVGVVLVALGLLLRRRNT
jgi:MYXO-CTERM domain-containing protein